MSKIKFGAVYTTEYALIHDWDRNLAPECEKLGYHSIYLTDHFFERSLECWTRLSALAMITNKIRLGTMVLCNSLRNPALLAYMAATLDIISNGRLELGIGAGYQPIDYSSAGIPLPRPSVRIAQLEESVEIIKKMWTEDRPSYKGKYYWIKDARCPKPMQKPHPPILIGGLGEKLALKVIAEHADICNLPVQASVEECRRKLGVLEKHCEAVGRDFDEIEKSWYGFALVYRTREELKEAVDLMGRYLNTPDTPELYGKFGDLAHFKETHIVGTPEECAGRMQEFVDIGITYFTPWFINRKSIKTFAEEVIPRIKIR